MFELYPSNNLISAKGTPKYKIILFFRQRRAFVSGNVIRFVAFNFILRICFRGVMGISFVVEIGCVHLDDGARNAACFRIPAYFIADFKFFGHCEQFC